jgi:hypothetical protein
MWPDNETGRDFLSFTGVADTTAEIIVRGLRQPHRCRTDRTTSHKSSGVRPNGA